MSMKKNITCGLAVVSLLIGLISLAPAGYSAQKDKGEKSKKQKDDKDKDKDKSDKKADKSETDNPLGGRPILWMEPNDIESRDLFYGPGGQEGAPDPSGKFTFQKRSTSGTSEKIIVADDKGREWTVK